MKDTDSAHFELKISFHFPNSQLLILVKQSDEAQYTKLGLPWIDSRAYEADRFAEYGGLNEATEQRCAACLCS